jgi:predicted phosphatase
VNDILERLDDLYEKVSDVDSITVLDARSEIVKLRKSLQKIMRMAKNNSTHAWDSHAEYWRMAKAGLGEDQ